MNSNNRARNSLHILAGSLHRNSLIHETIPLNKKRKSTFIMPRKGFEAEENHKDSIKKLISDSYTNQFDFLENDEGSQDFRVSVLAREYYEEKEKILVQPTQNINRLKTSNDTSQDFVEIRKKNKFEKIDEKNDRLALLELRKALLRIGYGISDFCYLIIGNKFFEYFIILVIITNIFLISYENDDMNAASQIDLIFLVIYTIEACLKILALGLILTPRSYLRDNWNKMDALIVTTGWLSTVSLNNINFSAIRTLRILRPLRSISSISGLRVLFVALIKSIIPLLASFSVIFFFILIFAILGIQLWSGEFLYQCMDLMTGEMTGELCGVNKCTALQKCVHSLDNPNFGTSNFDNIFYALLNVFQVITMEGWSDIMIYAQMTFSDYVIFYFFAIIFIGTFLLLSMSLAVIKNSFTKAMQEMKEEKPKAPDKDPQKTNISKLFRPEIQEFEPESPVKSEADQSSPNKNYELETEHIDKITFNNKTLRNQGIAFNMTPAHQRKLSFQVEDPIIENSFSLIASLNESNHSIDNSKIINAQYRKSISLINSNENFRNSLKSATLVDSNFRNRFDLKTRLFCQTLMAQDNDFFSNFAYTNEISELKFVFLPGGEVENPSTQDIIPNDVVETEISGTLKFMYSNLQQDPIEYVQDRGRKCMIEKFDHIGDYFKIFNLLVLKSSKKEAFLQFFFKTDKVIDQVQIRDLMSQSTLGIWSGYSVDPLKDSFPSISSLNSMTFHHNFLYTLNQLKQNLAKIVDHKNFSIAMIISVIINTIVLSIDHYGISPSLFESLSYINLIFTYIFLSEMILKLLAKGPINYIRDFMNCFDGIVVVLSLVELIFLSNSKSALTAFRTVRIFRVFRVIRVIRVARLFRYLQSMALILEVISGSLSKFIYLALLLLLFIIIYTLLFIQIFKGKFEFDDGRPRSNFDSFHNSFLSTFQVLSLENWQQILYSSMRANRGPVGTLALISWIVLGNYILLNLFIAILLEGFNSKDEDLDHIFNEGERRKSGSKKTLFATLDGHIRKKHEEKRKMMKEIDVESEESQSMSRQDFVLERQKTFFDGVDCDRSYFVFGKQQIVRKWCMRVCKNKYFDTGVLVIITLSTFKIVIDTYFIDEPSTSTVIYIMNFIDLSLTILFILEFLIKSVAFGFFQGQSSYIRDHWNQLDFIIIIFSVIDLSVSNINLSSLKSIRVLRTLRPLRFISHNVSMKVVVVALFDSVIAIFNVIIVLLIVWLMFAILGVSLLGGKLYSCADVKLQSRSECEDAGFAWTSKEPNYDNVINAISALFILSSEEGWPDIMYTAVDARGVDLALKKDSNEYIAYYFVIFILIGSFFFINFFIGVVFDKFNMAKKYEMSIASLVLSRDQALWVEIQKYLPITKPQVEEVKKKSRTRQFCCELYKSKAFELFIILIIMVNIVQMAMVYNEAPESYLRILENINLAITVVFILEAVIKLYGAGVKEYFSSNWNRFDFFVVTCSVLDILMSLFLTPTTILLRLGPQMLKMIRILRMSKIIRIFKVLKNLETLITIVGYSLPAILNVLSLMLLIFLIYSVLGVNLFHSISSGKIISPYTNFHNFGKAMITLFRISTGEDWNSIMLDCSIQVNRVICNFYFMSFLTITSFIMLNFFIMVILQTYDDFEQNPFHIFKKFTHDVKILKKLWAKYSFKHGPTRIHFRELLKLLKELGRDFGDFDSLDYDKMMKKLSAIQIEIDSFGFIFFHDYLFAVMRLKYRKRIIGKESALNKKIIRNEELKTMKKLAKVREKVRQQCYTEDQVGYLKKNHGMNFLIEILNVKAVFKAWKNRVKRKKEKIYLSISITPEDSIVQYPGENSIISDKKNLSYTEELF